MTSTAERVQSRFPPAGPRIVVVGTGIAGATFAACLRRRGPPCAVVEREPAGRGEGYMLGLLPLGAGLFLAGRHDAMRSTDVEDVARRTLARPTFVDSTPGAFLRDQVVRLYTLGLLTRSIRRTIAEPPARGGGRGGCRPSRPVDTS